MRPTESVVRRPGPVSANVCLVCLRSWTLPALSIQVHPTKVQAAAGFARENAAGIGLDAAERNNKGENHKPEMAVALTDFWMPHGFRPLDQIADALRKVPELDSIMPGVSTRLAHAGDDSQDRRDFAP